jgi:hypothetical protein
VRKLREIVANSPLAGAGRARPEGVLVDAHGRVVW